MAKYRPYGKYVRNNIRPVSFCDISGQYFNATDMVKQMEYQGEQLVWKGLMVGKRFADIPNPQNKSFKPKREFVPIKNLRINPTPRSAPAPLLSLQENIEDAQNAMVNGNLSPLFNDLENK